MRNGQLRGPHTHGRVVQGQAILVPDRRRRRSFQRVVVICRHVECAFNNNVGAGKCRLDVAPPALRGHQATEEPVWLVGQLAALIDRCDRRRLVEACVDEPGRVLRAFVAVGNDDRDWLAVVVDLVVLQREETLPGRGCADERGQKLWLAGNRGQVVVGQDGDDPVGIEGSAAIDRL